MLLLVAALTACGGDSPARVTGPATEPAGVASAPPVSSPPAPPAPAPSVAAIAFPVRDLGLLPGHHVGVAARALDAVGGVVPHAVIRYESSDPSVAVVDTAGRLSALRPGSAVIRATAGSARAELAVHVELPRPGDYRVEIRSAGVVPAHVLAAATHAATRWERVIRGDIADVDVALPAATCDAAQPAVASRVDDVVVFVRIGPIDGSGGALAVAGPCLQREADALPVVAVVRLDAEDMVTIEGADVLESVLAHEIGHALGIGTAWHAGVTPLAAGGAYRGSHARRASAALGFTSLASETVPLELAGGSGSRDLHWSEAVFQRELMTGWISNTGTPLSAVTVGGLADLGYDVQAAAADPFTPTVAVYDPGWTATLAAVRTNSLPVRDVVREARWVTGADGRIRHRAP